MAQESQQRLDAQFAFEDSAGVQLALRLLVKVIEARLASLEAQRADYDGAINALTGVALTRINEVLTPSLLVLQQLVDFGFTADRIIDSSLVGRQVLTAETGAAARLAMGAASAADVTDALADVTGKVAAIMAGADPALDTFLELSQRLAQDATGLTNLLAAVNLRLRIDAAQALSPAQQAQGLANLGISDLLRYGAQTLSAGQQSQARANIGAVDAGSTAFVRRVGTANDIKFNWDGGHIQAVVDALPLGFLWCNANAPNSVQISGYQYLPSGLIIQWGNFTSPPGGDVQVAFPIAFPNVLLSLAMTPDYYPGANELVSVSADQRQKSGFAYRPRQYIDQRYTVIPLAGMNCSFIAIGY